jgi:hypothetical protein
MKFVINKEIESFKKKNVMVVELTYEMNGVRAIKEIVCSDRQYARDFLSFLSVLLYLRANPDIELSNEDKKKYTFDLERFRGLYSIFIAPSFAVKWYDNSGHKHSVEVVFETADNS